jgi:hypothetical protein
MSRLASRFARDRPFGDQVPGQFVYLAVDRQSGQIAKQFQAQASEDPARTS